VYLPNYITAIHTQDKTYYLRPFDILMLDMSYVLRGIIDPWGWHNTQLSECTSLWVIITAARCAAMAAGGATPCAPSLNTLFHFICHV